VPKHQAVSERLDDVHKKFLYHFKASPGGDRPRRPRSAGTCTYPAAATDGKDFK
jgi:hypothetical protein